MSHSSARLLYWSPRILGIAYAAFLSIFAFDVFNEAEGFWPTLFAFAIHLIPCAIVTVILVVAWRWAWIGAALFAAAAALYAWSVLPRHVNWALILGLPLLAIAALFLTNWIERSKLRLAL